MHASSTSHHPQQAPSLPLPWVERIFARMAALYGSLFLDRWREVDPDTLRETWAEELGGFMHQPEAIRDALAALRDVPLPPTLPEFVALCRKAALREGSAKALPPPAVDIETARQRIAELKNRMRAAA